MWIVIQEVATCYALYIIHPYYYYYSLYILQGKLSTTCVNQHHGQVRWLLNVNVNVNVSIANARNERLLDFDLYFDNLDDICDMINA